jgi:hypothetical protein
MSWGNFKNTLKPLMTSMSYGKDMKGFATAFTLAYDVAIKSGKEPLNDIPLLNGNTKTMQALLLIFLEATQIDTKLTFLDVVGPAILSYWGGTSLLQLPPKIPAAGSIQNVSTIVAPVLSIGSWTKFPVAPSNSPDAFLDAFINSAKLHLSTISGIYQVMAQYPPPAPIAPGIVPWSGYYVSD